MTKAKPRGYALITVLLALGLLSVSIGVLLSSLHGSVNVTGLELHRRQTFYACDGVGRAMTKLAQQYFLTGSPTNEGLINYICEKSGDGCQANGTGPAAVVAPKNSANITLPKATPTGYVVDSLSLRQVGLAKTAPLPNGPFEGMSARQNTIAIELRMRQEGSDYACETNQEIALGKISMFQFWVFSDISYTDLFPGPAMVGNGQFHANGKICLAGANLKLAKVTSSEAISHVDGGAAVGSDGHCFTVNNTQNGVSVLTNSSDTVYKAFPMSQKHDGTWPAFAKTTKMQDKASHDVNALKLPVVGAPAVQAGVTADGTIKSNRTTSRFLIDPVRTGDAADVKSQKFAHKADIRIIGQTWYKNNGSWPGQVIYSDDPNQPVTGTRGKAYSYYDRDAAGAIVVDANNTGVVSYGLLATNTSGASATWTPGFRCPPIAPANASVITKHNDECTVAGVAMPAADKLLRGASDGFRDTHEDYNSDDTSANRFPLNFDVAAFQRALANTSAGELGSHFPGGSFNGIIYIAATDGSDPQWDAGYSASTNAIPENSVGNGVTSTTFVKRDAATVLAGTAARINAVRVFNARNINEHSAVATPDLSGATKTLPEGLTIASNLPVYVQGDANLTSNRDTGAPWYPFLVAGDVVYALSNAWQDNAAKWDRNSCTAAGACQTIQDGMANRNAVDTVYRMQVLAGTPETSGNFSGTSATSSGGVHNFVRFMEAWSGRNCVIKGSTVIGFYPVYSQFSWRLQNAYSPPTRDYGYDKHLDDLSNQPPGAPLYEVQAIRGWSRN
jgi:type II secretory pathway pseudopilin PulG